MFFEFKAARGAEHCAALLDDTGNIADRKIDKVAVDQALVTVKDTLDLDTAAVCIANDCANCGIHALRIAAAGQNTDGFNFHADEPPVLCIRYHYPLY